MAHRPWTAPPPRPQQGMLADKDIVGPHTQKSDGAGGARPKNSMHSRHKDVILASEEPEGDQANVGPRVRESGYKATMGVVKQESMETATGDETVQRALLACSIQEDGYKEQSPPKRLHALNACGHQEGKEGGDPSPGSAGLRPATRDQRGSL